MILYMALYYFLAGLAINLGYHRCLSHRALRLPRMLERLLITIGLPAGTPIQWAGNHRFHHRFADQAADPHSPNRGGFWHAHVGWYIGTSHPVVCFLYAIAGPLRTWVDGWHRPRSNQEHNLLASDVSADPYYRWISRPLPFLAACVLHTSVVFGIAYWGWGVKGLAVMWLSSTLVYNVGDSIDSVAHLFGEKIGNGPDQARNHWVMGILALGEGWHGNHHAFPRSARHGLNARQLDWTWMVIRTLERLGLATHVVRPPKPFAAMRQDTAA